MLEKLYLISKHSIQHSNDAIDLALDALKNDSEEVRRLAKLILRDRCGSAGKEALLNQEPLSYFVKLGDWRQQFYDDYEEISNPENTAYIIEINSDRYWGKLNNGDLREFESIK